MQDLADLIRCLIIGIKFYHIITDLRIPLFRFHCHDAVDFILYRGVFPQHGSQQGFLIPLDLDGDHIGEMGL